MALRISNGFALRRLDKAELTRKAKADALDFDTAKEMVKSGDGLTVRHNPDCLSTYHIDTYFWLLDYCSILHLLRRRLLGQD